MIFRKSCELEPILLEKLLGGEGTVIKENLLSGVDEMLGKGRTYARITLQPGVSIGQHLHVREMESMFVVSGKGEHTVDGIRATVEAGDIFAAMPGETHGIINTGCEPLVLIAQVLFEHDAAQAEIHAVNP